MKGKRMSDSKSSSVSFIKSIIDKKFSKANTNLADMMKNKAMTAIADFKTSFKYIPNGCSTNSIESGGQESSKSTDTDGC